MAEKGKAKQRFISEKTDAVSSQGAIMMGKRRSFKEFIAENFEDQIYQSVWL